MSKTFNLLYHIDNGKPHFDLFYGQKGQEIAPKWHTESIEGKLNSLGLTEFRDDCSNSYLTLEEPKIMRGNRGIVFPILTGDMFELENGIYRLESQKIRTFDDVEIKVYNWINDTYTMDTNNLALSKFPQ